MDYQNIILELKDRQNIKIISTENYNDEIEISVDTADFAKTCLLLHKLLHSPVMMLFAEDARSREHCFVIRSVFMSAKYKKWLIVNIRIPEDNQFFDSIAKNIYSASLFEREIKEMFGIEPRGNPDLRRLNLHDEVWPKDNYPLRKDFKKAQGDVSQDAEYKFTKGEGEGIFEVPVGPVHAGIIGPGHFRFSVAGEPIINLEIRLGFTHRGVEKAFEGKDVYGALRLSECVAGDSVFAHSLCFCQAIEKICGVSVSKRQGYLRAIFLELERMYNHVADIGGAAVDVGFSFPATLAAVIKENLLRLNEELADNRYLKGVNVIGGVSKDIDQAKKALLLDRLKIIMRDFEELKGILDSSVSFMDRVDSTGVLKKKTAEDLGIVGLAARAAGIPSDLRKDFPGVYADVKFKIITQEAGDVLSRLRVRIFEFEESVNLIRQFLERLPDEKFTSAQLQLKEGCALGYTEGWRGPLLYWVKIDQLGKIERCKIVDPSFHNWQGLAYSVLGDIIPDFPLCNKSFNLSYSGNDL